MAKIQKTSPDGATIDGKFITWKTLRNAAGQEDQELSREYSAILKAAQVMESRRKVSEDWKTYGYPLRTGFSRYYAGQIVQKAWEIRRIQKPYKDVRMAYIVEMDWSDRSVRRIASPEFLDYDAAMDWVSKNYRAWEDELGAERSAMVWFRY